MKDENKDSRSARDSLDNEKFPGEPMPDEATKPEAQGVEAKRGKRKIRKDRDSRPDRD